MTPTLSVDAVHASATVVVVTAVVYRLAGALPRAFLVGAQRVVDGEDAALEAITRPGFDARRVAITEKPLDGLPRTPGAEAAGSAEIVSYKPERVVVRARSAGAGLVVLGDNQYPGWKATVAGKDVPIERVDYLFRGVQVGPGEHTVVFRYEPLSWRIGWIVSLVSLAGLVLAFVIGVRRQRRSRGPEDDLEPLDSVATDQAQDRAAVVGAARRPEA